MRIVRHIKKLLTVLLLSGLVITLLTPMTYAASPPAASTLTQDGEDNPYLVETFVDSNGRQVCKIIVPGRPPDVKVTAVSLPESNSAAGVNILTDIPAFNWSYGCSATSAAMLFGYYDRTGYSNMYAGPTNGGLCPLDNTPWLPKIDPVSSECPLSATHSVRDGLVSYGHVDDYWVSYGSTDDDPYIDEPGPDVGWTEHTHADCTADFMGTNQSKFNNSDGSTSFWYFTDGSPFRSDDAELYLNPNTQRDGGHGVKLFAESRGYTVTAEYNQLIYGYGGNTLGFTFADYMAEIDAGRPVLIHVLGHTMLGFGYDDTTNEVYLHDTWDYSDHTMTWGGSYDGMDHYMVTVLQMAPPESDPPYTSGHDPADLAIGVPIDTSIVVHVQDDDAGVDDSTIAMTVNDVDVTSDLVITGTTPADYTVTYDPPSEFDYSQLVEVTVDASDLAGNAMTRDAYSFVIEDDPVPPIPEAPSIILFGAGLIFVAGLGGLVRYRKRARIPKTAYSQT